MAMEIYIGGLAAVAAAGGMIHVLTRTPNTGPKQLVARKNQGKPD